MIVAAGRVCSAADPLADTPVLAADRQHLHRRLKEFSDTELVMLEPFATPRKREDMHLFCRRSSTLLLAGSEYRPS
jgi:hypothetical protein